MSDANSSAPAAAAATPSKVKKVATKGGAKNPKSKSAHPPTGEMVNAAIAGLKERGGSSLQAIKKYIAANYKVDTEKLAPFIKKYLKSAVASGALSQPKGKGASGSFKISVKGESKSSAVKKPKAAKSVAKPKKPAAASKPKNPAKKAVAKAAKPKSPSKAKKVSKPPTKKPKSPKAKKTAVKKAKSPKKAAAAKKK